MIEATFDAGQVKTITDKVVGTICSEDDAGKLVFGAGKVQFSYDERFLVTHSYNPRYVPANDKDNRVKESSSDIFIHDLLTGKSLKVTDTPAGVYALYPHFRNDGYLYFMVRTRDGIQCGTKVCPDSMVVSDVALRMAKE
jgi:hypothetical protein